MGWANPLGSYLRHPLHLFAWQTCWDVVRDAMAAMKRAAAATAVLENISEITENWKMTVQENQRHTDDKNMHELDQHYVDTKWSVVICT